MAGQDNKSDDTKIAYETLVRLANSCDREAGRGKSVTPIGGNLNEEDLRIIADVLRRFAGMIANGTS